MRRDGRVQRRLCHGGQIVLRMPQPTIAEQINHDVRTMLHAVLKGDPRSAQDRFRVVCVDMQHRRINHARHVGAIVVGAHVHHVGRRESDLVVDDDVHDPACRVAAPTGEVQGFHDNALTGERRVAVHHHRQAWRVGMLVQVSARHTANNRIHALQMRGVRRQHQCELASIGGSLGEPAKVVRQIALCDGDFGIRIQPIQHALRIEAHHVDQRVQAPAMRQAEKDLSHTATARLVEQRFE